MKCVTFCGSAIACGCFLLLQSGHLDAAEPEQTIFQFRTPQTGAYRVETSPSLQSATNPAQWLRAWPQNGSTNFVEFGSRVVLQLNSQDELKRLTDGHALALSRTVTSNVFILQSPDAVTAMREAHRLASLPEVLACYPVMKRQMQPDGAYAPRSNDPFFLPYFNAPPIDALWPLENRDYDGTRLGFDLNVLAAWPFGMGQGVTVAVADSGLETNHPELTNRLAGAPHFNFGTSETNAAPLGGDKFDPHKETWTHGTSVGGLIAAEGNNGRGPVGVAPLASLAGWVIYATNEVVDTFVENETNIYYFTNIVVVLVPDESLMDLYQYASDIVAIQNHSWGGGNGVKAQVGPALLEQIGIANATALGRNGLGTVLVRAAGNDRSLLGSANDDGYPNDPQVIAVAAVDKSGRAADYSEPGACVLVGAPGGSSSDSHKLFTLDLVGVDRGANAFINYFQPDLSDYRWGIQGFAGTSAATPLVSGIAALMLSVNPNLGYRDVQQILALSARHYDMADPDLVRNGAGFLVSHNVGFGVPDAGHAVRLAGLWTNRPALTTVSITDTTPLLVTDEGLRVEITGDDVPSDLASIQCFPSLGPHADQPTAALPLVDVGEATSVPAINLTNKGALILRDTTSFNTKISNAAKAGAAFAIIYNSTNDSSINFGLVTDTEYSSIPAVLISNSKGEALRSLFQTNGSALARIRLLSSDRVFHVNSTLLCEHVGVRVRSDHPKRGDLRITLQSPQGTRSRLQRLNDDTNPGPDDWTYWSTHHFYEGSAGDWTVSISDEAAGVTGPIRSVSLVIRGTQIADADGDGLDDGWETNHFGNLSHGPKDDLEPDGYSNAREQVMGTDPNAADVPFQLDLSPWQLTGTRRMRLSWPANTNFTYEVLAGTNAATLSSLTNLPGQFPEMDFLTPYTGKAHEFFRVLATPVQ